MGVGRGALGAVGVIGDCKGFRGLWEAVGGNRMLWGLQKLVGDCES